MSRRWSLLVVTPSRAHPFDIPTGRTLLVGRSRHAQLVLDEHGVAERHLSLVPRDEGLRLELPSGAGAVRVNDVVVSAATVLEVGDEVGLGPCSLVVLPGEVPVRPKVRLGSHDALMMQLSDALVRGGRSRPVGLVLVGLPHLNAAARQALVRRLFEESQRIDSTVRWSEYAPDVLGAVVAEVAPSKWNELLQDLTAAAGQRARVGASHSSVDGLGTEQLIEVAMEQLIDEGQGRDEPAFFDAGMVRLVAKAETLAARPGAVLLSGPSGSGRRTLARLMARSAGVELRVVRELQTTGGSLLVEDAQLFEPTKLAAWAHARTVAGERTFLVSTGFISGLALHLAVPGLAARPGDVVPLAETFLAQARRRVGRPRLALGSEALGLLEAYGWPGNVRELRNVMVRAARAAVRDEVGRDALPEALVQGGPTESLKGALRATERELMLEALSRTRWNVSAAAVRLGLPRRTVVYRMKKLGLRRPARST